MFIHYFLQFDLGLWSFSLPFRLWCLLSCVQRFACGRFWRTASSRSRAFVTVLSLTRSRRERGCRCRRPVLLRLCTTWCVPAGLTTHPLARQPVKSRCVCREKSHLPQFTVILVRPSYIYLHAGSSDVLLIGPIFVERTSSAASRPSHQHLQTIPQNLSV